MTPALFIEGEVVDDKAIGKIEGTGKCTDAKVCVSPTVKKGNLTKFVLSLPELMLLPKLLH